MATKHQEVKNEHIEVKITQKPGCEVQLEVFVTPVASKVAYEKALKTVNQEVSLPGFRKGRAPSAMIEKHYKKHVDNEWYDLLVKTAYKEATALTTLYPMDQERMKRPDVKGASKEDGANIFFSFIAAPIVPPIDPEKLHVKNVEPKPILEKNIDEAFEDLRLHFADWKEIEERAVEEGDFVDLDIKKIDEPSQMLVENTRFPVQDGKMGAWMRKLVVGLKKGESAEGTSELDSGFLETKEEFTPTNCKITVNAIYRPDLPVVNEEFFEKLKSEGMDDTRKKLRYKLEKEAALAAKEQMLEELKEKLAESYDFDLPVHLVEKEKERYIVQKVEEQGDKNLPKIEEEAEPVATRALKLSFILMDTAQRNKLEVQQQELTQEAMQVLMRYGSSLNEQAQQTIMRQVYYSLLNRKAEEHLLEHAKKT